MNVWLTSLRGFLRLPGDDQWLTLQAIWFLFVARAAMKRSAPRALLSMGAVDIRTEPEERVFHPSPEELRPVLAALERSCSLFRFPNCLTRAIALRMLLAERGIDSELHIGARKDERGEFAAHAWLTYQDVTLVGGDDSPDLYRRLISSSHTLLQ